MPPQQRNQQIPPNDRDSCINKVRHSAAPDDSKARAKRDRDLLENADDEARLDGAQANKRVKVDDSNGGRLPEKSRRSKPAKPVKGNSMPKTDEVKVDLKPDSKQPKTPNEEKCATDSKISPLVGDETSTTKKETTEPEWTLEEHQKLFQRARELELELYGPRGCDPVVEFCPITTEPKNWRDWATKDQWVPPELVGPLGDSDDESLDDEEQVAWPKTAISYGVRRRATARLLIKLSGGST